MIKSKKADLDEIILDGALIIGVIIIGLWFILYVGKLSIKDQNLSFKFVSDFSQYYTLTCNSIEAEIKNIEFSKINEGNLSIKKNQVCYESKNIAKICQEIICNSSNTLPIDYNFALSNQNFFC